MTRDLRIVVTGGSVASMLSPPRTAREQGAYAELLPEVLARRGVQGHVYLRSRWFGMVRDLRREYEEVIRDRMPDVVILNFGMGECQPNMLPTWFVRHLGTWNRSGRTQARAYYRFVLDPLWPALRKYQQVADRVPIYRMSPRAFRAEMTRVIALTRLETRALVLVLDQDPAGSRLVRWMPSIRARRERYQVILQEVADRFGPDVRLVPVSETVRGREEELVPDGLHRTPEGHLMMAERIADEIVAWAAQTDGPDRDDPHRWV